MSDREMLAYAILLIGVLVYAAVFVRWWYMSPTRMIARKERRASARYNRKRAAESNAEQSESGGAGD